VAENIFRLPDEHRQLLRRYYRTFYLLLDHGHRVPDTEAQEHFVAVCRGKLPPKTPHEFAYANFKKFCSLSGLSAEEVEARDFSFPTPEPIRPDTPKPPESRYDPQYSGEECPRCANQGVRALLVWRRARDPSIPGEFLGCSRYPNCQYKES
jgi:hypothetical protein